MAETINTKAFYNTEIPGDWVVKHFEDIADIDKNSLNGRTPKDYEFDYISLSDVDSDDFKIETTRQVLASAPSRARRIVKQGDILMSTVRPNLQGFSLIRNEVKDLIASTGFAVITTKKCSNEYLFQYLFSAGINRQFFQLLVGSNYPAINSSDVRKLKIPLPPLPEQKAIAQVLSTADAAIHTTEKLIAQKELRKKWLMQQLLTGKKRLFSRDEIGDMSYEMKRVKFGEFALIKKGKALTSSEIIDGDIPVIAGGQSSPYKHNAYTHENVITISASGAYAGFVAFHKGKIWASDCSVVEDIEGKSIISYLYYVLVFNQDKIYKLQTGGAQPHVYPDDIHNLSLIIHSSLKEQTAIAQVLQAADKEISLLKAKAEKLREQKKGLMQVLLTGKKRLNLDSLDLGIEGLDITKSSNHKIK